MNTMDSKKYILFAFYAAMLAALVLWTNTTPPPMQLRMLYLLILCIPVIFYSKRIFPLVLIIFSSISKFSPYPTFMPTDAIINTFFVGLILLLTFRGTSYKMKYPVELILLIVYTVLVDILTGGRITSVSYCLITLFFLSYFISKDDVDITNAFPFGFVLASFVLSVVYVVSMSKFVTLVNASQGIERVEWTDPNYFGFVIGMGTFCAINSLFQKQVTNKKLRLFLIATIIVSSMVLVLNASRGALLSVLIVAMIILLFSKTKIIYKVLAALFGIGLVYFLYSEGYMELLMYRVTEGVGDGGGGRLYIWDQKLSTFFTNANFAQLLLGMGYYCGYNLGFGHGQGFHNDFVAFFVDYGIIGVSLFVIPFIKLLIRSIKLGVPYFCTWLYLVLCGMTIEPFTLGVLPYYLFFIYVISSIHLAKRKL